MDTFLGEKVGFWIALKERINKIDATDMMREIVSLRARVSFYESRFDETQKFQRACFQKEVK